MYNLITNIYSSDLQVIIYHVQNALDKCIAIENDINLIIINHEYGRSSENTIILEVKSNSFIYKVNY